MELKLEVAEALAAALGTPLVPESRKTFKVISNRDGCSGRRDETYASYEACSYRVEDERGQKVGRIDQLIRRFADGYTRKSGLSFDLEPFWCASVGEASASFQRFSDAKAWAQCDHSGCHHQIGVNYDY